MLAADGEPGSWVVPQGGPLRRPIDPVFGLPPQARQAISALRLLQGRDGRWLSWRGGQERAPCLVSSSPHYRTRLECPGAGFTVSAGSET